MSEQDKTDALKNTLNLVLEGLSVGLEANKDGKIGWSDLALLGRMVDEIGPAISTMGEIPTELSQLDAAAAAQLVEHVMLKLMIDDAKARAVIEKSLKLVVAGYELVQAVRA
jgi:hypothetical protein